MTTDIAEVTQASAPATQAEPVTESTPSADELTEARVALGVVETPNAPSTEATVAGTEPQVDDDIKALLDAAKTSAAEDAAVKAREDARKEVENTRRAEEARRQIEGVDRSFKQRAQAIREFGEQQGWDTAAVNRIVETFNAHHAQSATIAAKDYWDHTVDYAVARLDEASSRAILADYNAQKFDNFHQLLDRITEAKATSASAGRFTEAQVKERELLAYIKGKRAVEGQASTRVGLPQSRATPSSSSIAQDQRNLADPKWVAEAPLAEVTAARARVNGTQ